MLVWGCAVSTSSPLTASIIRLWAMPSRKCSYVSPGRSAARRSLSACGSVSTLSAVPSASTGRSCFPCSTSRCDAEESGGPGRLDAADGPGCCGMYTMGLHGVSFSNSMKTGSSIAHLQRVEHNNDPRDCAFIKAPTERCQSFTTAEMSVCLQLFVSLGRALMKTLWLLDPSLRF